MGLLTFLKGVLLLANALAILNEERFLAPRGWGRRRHSREVFQGPDHRPRACHPIPPPSPHRPQHCCRHLHAHLWLRSQIFQQMQAPVSTPQLHQPAQITIKDLRPTAFNNINTVFIILEKGATLKNDKKLAMCISLAADQTAAVHLQLWGDECEFFQPGDIVRLTNGIFSTVHGNMVLRAGRKGKLEKIGEFTMVYTEIPNMSKLQWVQEPSNPSQWVPKELYSPQMPNVAHSTAPPGSQRLILVLINSRCAEAVGNLVLDKCGASGLTTKSWARIMSKIW